MEKIRNEVHTRSKFACKKYYEIIRQFAITNFTIRENKIKKDFKYLSVAEHNKMHTDLERCYKIYNFYKAEYNASLDKINLLEK